MFYLVGLGLGGPTDITVKVLPPLQPLQPRAACRGGARQGLEVVKRCSRVLLESYTAILCGSGAAELSAFYGACCGGERGRRRSSREAGREVEVADRELVEQGAEGFLEQARTEEVALLVVGDPYGATTHTDLVTRCHKTGVPVHTVHNASIMNAVGCAGLQLYNYGRTVSIVFFTETWRPDSFYAKIRANADAGLHTLLLLDIKVKEQSVENMMRGRKVFEPPRFMTINQCIAQLLEVEEKLGGGACTPDSRAVGVARVGHDSQQVVSGTLSDLLTVDFGGPLHSLCLCGETDEVEDEMLVRARPPLAPRRALSGARCRPSTLFPPTRPGCPRPRPLAPSPPTRSKSKCNNQCGPPAQSGIAGFCVSSSPKRFLSVTRCREYLSSGENRAGCADSVALPAGFVFCGGRWPRWNRGGGGVGGGTLSVYTRFPASSR